MSSRHAGGPSLTLLAAASALSPFGMAVVLPTLDAIAGGFDVGYAEAQFVISAYLFGLGVMQPFSGLLCDRLGRRPVMLGGVLVFGIASAGCALTADLWTLVVLRFVQALGISVGTVTSRAIIRDTHDLLESTRALGRLAAAMGVAPVVAPILGGALVGQFGIRSVFAVTALMAAAVLAWLWRDLPETGARAHAGEAGEAVLAGYGELLRSRTFVGNTLLFGFIQGAFFAFLAVGSPVFERALGLDQQVFGLVWGVMGVAYVSSASAAGRLIDRLGHEGLLKLGALLTLASGWGIFLLNAFAGTTLVTLVLPLLVLMIASGFVTPLAMAGAVGGRPALAGRAAGLSGAVGLMLSGAFSILSGFVFTGSFVPSAFLMALAATLTAAMLPFTRPAR